MIEAPEFWTSTTVGEVTLPVDKHRPEDEPRHEFRYVDISSIDNGSNMVVEPKLILGRDAPSRARQLVRAGDTVLSTVRTYLKNTALVPADLDGATASTGFSVLRPDPDRVDPRFLFYRVLEQGFVEELSEKQTGTSYPAVRDRDVRAMAFSHPPLNEQHRIVETVEDQFSRLDAGVESLQRAKRNLRHLRGSILRSAMQGQLARREPAPVAVSDAVLSIMARADRAGPDPASLAPIPEPWVWLWLPELGELGRGKSKHRPRNDPTLYGGPYPFVQTGDVRNSGGRITRHSQTYSEEGLAQSRLWPSDTVCITIAANIADSALLTYPACFPDSVVGLIANRKVALPEFVEMFMRTARSRLDAYAPATAQKNINLQILSKVAVPVPPIEEQAKIVDEASRYQSIIEMAESQIETGCLRSVALHKAILSDAFEGRLLPSSRSVA